MKKIFSLLVMFLALSCMHVSAQNGANKMIVVNKDGSKSGYIIENLDSIFFAKTPGTASVSLTAGSLVDDELLYPMVRATIKKEDQCQSFRYTVVPKAEADAMVSDADVINYFNTFASKSYTEDLNDEILRNVILSRGTTNTILAVAYDEYNVACSASKADFEIPGDFEITVANVSYLDARINITPSDETMTYLTDIVEKEYGMSDRDIYEKDRAYLKKQSEIRGQSLEGILSSVVSVGKLTDASLILAEDNSDYIIYAYGVDIRTGEPTTGITRVPLHTPSIEKTDVKFDITADVTDGVNLDISCKPVNYDGFYKLEYFEIDENTSIEELKRDAAESWKLTVNTLLSYEYGMDVILSSFCKKGDYKGNGQDLKATKQYLVWAYAVNNDGVINSDFSVIKFKTGKAPKTSENILTLKVKDILPYYADIHFEGTKRDEYFTVYSGFAEEFEGLEGDDLLQYITDKMDVNPYQTNTILRYGPFLPNRKIRVYAYGIKQYSSFNPTTDLFEVEFETPEAVYDETLTGRLSYEKYYDATAVAELDNSYESLAHKGYVFLPADLTHSEEATLYTAFFTDKEIKGKTDEEITAMILKDYKNFSESANDYRIFSFPYGTEVTGFSVEVRYDEKTFSKPYRGEKIKISRGYLSIPQEFVDKYPNTSVTSPAQAKGNTTKKSENLIKADFSKIVKHNLGAANADINKFINR